jgi:hypothetical protein
LIDPAGKLEQAGMLRGEVGETPGADVTPSEDWR